MVANIHWFAATSRTAAGVARVLRLTSRAEVIGLPALPLQLLVWDATRCSDREWGLRPDTRTTCLVL